MAATVNPPTKAVAEWCKVFHAQGIENYTSSVTFMKQLSVVAVSIITYMKNAFPEDCYTVETFAGLQLKILKCKCEDEYAQFLSSALTQAFDALDKKYLHQLAICFYEDSCTIDNLVEYHIFEYVYNTDGVTMNIHSKNRNSQKKSLKCTFEDVKQQTTQLIRSCIVMLQSCQQQLPDTADVSIRLYYNDDAPEGYQAPGFRCAETEPDHLQPTRKDAIQLGSVETPYHKLIAKSYMRDNIRDSHEAIPSQNPPMLTQQDDFSGAIQRNVSDGSELQLICPCNKYEDVGNYPAPLLVTCEQCNTVQHASCFGLLPEHVRNLTQHCCTRCSDLSPWREPTDRRLAELTHRKRECLCIFRRTLEWCTHISTIDGANLMDRFGISTVNASKLMKLLESYGIIELETDSDLITPRKINSEALQRQISVYFRNDDYNIADRLLAETFASQESKEDPIGDVLSPLEKITLQNTSNLGRVIEKPVITPMDKEDQTLKQYREAILSVDTNVDMPMSDVVKDMKNMKKSVKRKIKDDVSDLKADKRMRTGVRNKQIRGSN